MSARPAGNEQLNGGEMLKSDGSLGCLQNEMLEQTEHVKAITGEHEKCRERHTKLLVSKL